MNDIVFYYLNSMQTELESFKNSFDISAFGEAIQYITTAEKNNNRIHITGIGKPSHLAGYIASLLSSTGTSTYFLDATEAVHGSSGQVKSGDVVIAISNSGETAELKRTVQTLKGNGAIIISVTGNPSSWLAYEGHTTLVASVNSEGDSLNLPPRLSIFKEMLVLQLLSLLLQEQKEINYMDYLKWHPSGALGDKAREEIRNIDNN